MTGSGNIPAIYSFPDMRKRGQYPFFSALILMRKMGTDPFYVNSLPGGISKREPPDPIPNSEVKLLSADDSVGLPHVKVGHCQAFIQNPCSHRLQGFLFVPSGCGQGSDLPFHQTRSSLRTSPCSREIRPSLARTARLLFSTPCSHRLQGVLF